jgi:hypothetical protein
MTALLGLGLTPEQFSAVGKGWIEAVATVLMSAIAQFGIIGAAAILAWQQVKTKARLEAKIETTKKEMSERLDTQGDRITNVAMAVPPVNGKPIPVEVRQPENLPVPVTEA